MNNMDVILFLIFALIAVVCGISLVVQTHPISSALSLIGVMVSLAVLYLLLGAEFIAAAQLIVYAGAIMVLFIFVIMLLNAGTETQVAANRTWSSMLGIPLFAAFIGVISFIIQGMLPKTEGVSCSVTSPGGAARTSDARCSPRICCRSKSPRS